MSNIIGTDISFWQDDNATPQKTDFNKMKTNGAEFVILRAGQGNWNDLDFKDYWRESKGPLPRGSYWYYDNHFAPEKQAELYVQQLGGDHGELPMFCDFEDRLAGKHGTWKHWYVFIERLKNLANKEIGIYSNYYYWTEKTIQADISSASLEYFKQYPLWIANYGVDKPLVPKPWTDWTFWQYTAHGDGLAYGVESRNIDLNYFNGDEEAFRKRFGLPPGGANNPVCILGRGRNKIHRRKLMYSIISALYNMAIRAEHNTGSQTDVYVPHPTPMIADQLWVATEDLFKTINGVKTKINAVGDQWAHIVSVNGVSKDGWTAIVHLGKTYCEVKNLDAPPIPAPIPTPTKTFPEYFILESPTGERKRYDRSAL